MVRGARLASPFDFHPTPTPLFVFSPSLDPTFVSRVWSLGWMLWLRSAPPARTLREAPAAAAAAASAQGEIEEGDPVAHPTEPVHEPA